MVISKHYLESDESDSKSRVELQIGAFKNRNKIVPRLCLAIGYQAADNLNVLKLVGHKELSLFFVIRRVLAGRDGASTVIELPGDVGGFDFTLLDAGCERNLEFLFVIEF
jgi:hypothetical protein